MTKDPEHQSRAAPARLGAPDERLQLHFSEVWSSIPPTPSDTRQLVCVVLLEHIDLAHWAPGLWSRIRKHLVQMQQIH
jgi:hypothetical protein